MAELVDAVALIISARLPDASSAEISEAVERAEFSIREYCHIPEDEPLPPNIKYVWVDMAVACVTILREGAGGGVVSKITEGDTTVEYSTPTNYTSISETYAADLRLWRRVPK